MSKHLAHADVWERSGADHSLSIQQNCPVCHPEYYAVWLAKHRKRSA